MTSSFVFGVVLFALFSLTFAQFAVSPSPTPKCPLLLPTPFDPPTPSSIQSRVVGGLRAPSLPYMVSIFKSGFFRCSGVVLSSTVVLTAADCTTSADKAAYEFFVRVGGETINSGVKIRVKEFLIHPNYNGFSFNQEYDGHFNVAVLILLHPIPNAIPVKVPIDPTVPSLWSYVRTIGFGTGIGDKPTDGFLKRGDTPVSPCSWVDPTNLGMTEFNFTDLGCAGGFTVSNCTACKGDRGGPWLQYDTSDSPVLVGISSQVSLCNSFDSVSVFIRPKEFVSWLEKIGVGFIKSKLAVKNVFVDPIPLPPARPTATPSPL